MKDYFFILLLTSVCGAVCGIIAQGGYESYIKYIASLVCVVVLVSPFRDIDVENLVNNCEINDSLSGTENKLYENTAIATENNAENYINKMVFEKFGINPSYVNIEIEWERETLVIRSVCVALSNQDVEYGNQIREYLFDKLGGEVKIIEE